MRPLIVGPAELAGLRAVREYAEAHPIPLVDLEDAIRTGRAAAEDPGFRCVVPIGIRVAFTIEEHPGGWARHLSMSLADAPGRLPNAEAVRFIGELLGMRGDLRGPGVFIYIERDVAVNYIEPLDEPSGEAGASP